MKTLPETRQPIGRARLFAAVLALVLPLACGSLHAAPIAPGQARRAVETWTRHLTAERRHDAVIERLEPFPAQGAPSAYIIHLAGGGYCLAGADDTLLPVYWYCPRGSYDPTDPGPRTILEEIANRLSFIRTETAKGGKALDPHKESLRKRKVLWQQLSSGTVAADGAGSILGDGITSTELSGVQSELVLPLTSQWSQNAPYNLNCPTAADTPTLVGCVATAMAQVMNYWRWPMQGAGAKQNTYTYRFTKTVLRTPLAKDPGIDAGTWGTMLFWASGQLNLNGIFDETHHEAARKISTDTAYLDAFERLWAGLTRVDSIYSADFGATPYRWDLLKDVHPFRPGISPDAGDTEVAKLCYHAGMAVDMGYGIAASGASPAKIAGAFAAHFAYDPDGALEGFNPDRLADEIQWQRPVILNGWNMNKEGHAWVVLGYRKGVDFWQFLMNMGWGNLPGWYGVDMVPGGFVTSQNIVVNVAPQDAVRFVGATAPGDGSPSSPYQDLQEARDHAPDNAVLIFKAGSVTSWSEPDLYINRPLTLKGAQATITR